MSSYPVGFEEIYYMYPMDFQEFIWAVGVQGETIDYLRDCWDNGTAVSEKIHQTMLRLFLLYIVVGGMSAVVQKYVDSNDIAEVIEKQQSILELYRQDIANMRIKQKTENKIRSRNIKSHYFDAKK